MSSVSKETEDRVDEMVNKRRLSFSREEPSQSIIIPASPDTMPGEVFQLENIVEEPNLQHAEGKAEHYREQPFVGVPHRGDLLREPLRHREEVLAMSVRGRV